MKRARQPKSQTEGLSAPKKDDVSPKMSPRSPAFSQALTNPRSYAKDPERLRQLFKEAVKKAPTIPRDPFKDLWAYFQAMLRLIRAYYGREYRNVPLQNLVMIVGAIIYILNPFDLIPDWIAGLCLAVDAVVLAFRSEEHTSELQSLRHLV